MAGSITDVAGIEVGHARDLERVTGCTVVLAREGAVVGVDVRGGAPGTRETDICKPGTLVERAHAVLLTGGSAFGLEAASGVMRFLHERDIGFDTGVARVPIVPGAVIFDLAVGAVAWPDGAMGYSACEAASGGAVEEGNVGAGTGATVAKLGGAQRAERGGVGTASARVGEHTVGALVVVNALGNIVLPDGTFLAGFVDGADGSDATFGNTTIGAVATDASLTDSQVWRLAQVAHDGLARAIQPVHTQWDGDTMFALATGRMPLSVSFGLLEMAVPGVVQEAVYRAIRAAQAAEPPESP